jgi:DNA-binding NtrC family response regulator
MTTESLRDRIGSRLHNLFRRVAAASHYFRKSPPLRGIFEPYVLTITADLSLYSSVLSATHACGWTTEWARSMKRAVEVCRSRVTPIVVFDRNLPDVDWRRALDQLSNTAYDVRILLAASEVDEDLWRNVIHRHGYDVLARSADPEQMKRELRFAWLSLDESRHHQTAVPALSRS